MNDRGLVELARRAKDCDPDAFAELFDRYFEKIRRYVYFHTGSIDLADELASEVFSQAMENIGGFIDQGGTIGAWLYGIARNIVAGHYRSAGRARESTIDERFPAPEGEGPESVVLERFSHEELYEAISLLTPEQRDVVILRFIEGHRVRTVARMLGKKEGAVRAQQHRAILFLRDYFERAGKGACRGLEAGEIGSVGLLSPEEQQV